MHQKKQNCNSFLQELQIPIRASLALPGLLAEVPCAFMSVLAANTDEMAQFGQFSTRTYKFSVYTSQARPSLLVEPCQCCLHSFFIKKSVQNRH